MYREREREGEIDIESQLSSVGHHSLSLSFSLLP
jgi:hypothetical protein